MAQAFFQYNLTVNSRQYKRELAQAAKLANDLANAVDKATKRQQKSLSSASEEVDRTKRRLDVLKNAIKAFPNVQERSKDKEFFKELSAEVAGAEGAFKKAALEVKRYQKTLSELNRIDLSKIRRSQVLADPQAAQKNLQRQRRANVTTAKSIQRVSNELREATLEQQRFVKAGLDTAQVDLKVAQLTVKHVKLNEALDKGVTSARRLEKELKDVANSQKLLGSTQFSRPIGPAAPMRGFRGNTGKRAALGGLLGRAGGGAGMMGAGAAALTGGIAGLAAALAGRLLQDLERFIQATAQYANDAAVAAAETTRMRRALAGVLGAGAPEAFEAIKRVVSDFNVPLQTATTQFTRFVSSAKASGVESDDIEKSFRGLIAANKALGGSQEQANGILLAATQIFGKGKTSAEELRGQIGERLPGAVAMFAESMGLTTAELDKRLEEGTVSVADFVKFTGDLLNKFEDDAKAISEGPEEAGQRLEVALDRLQRSIGAMLQPIGAAFQTTFALIVNAINAGIEAFNRFMGLDPESAVRKAEEALRAREQDVINARAGRGKIVNVGQQGMSRRQTQKEAEAERFAAAESLREARKLLGTGKGSIEKGKLVTAEDLIRNRQGSGGGRSPADIAAQVAKIESANRRRLVQEAAREYRKLADFNSAIDKRLEKEKQDLVLSGLRGAARAQQETINAYLTQNTAIEDQLNRLDSAVGEAEMRVKAARAELSEASSEVDRARKQGNLDREEAKLAGAQDRRTSFRNNIGTFQANNFQTMLAKSTAAFRERAAALKEETAELQLRNRLQLEGFSPEMIEKQLEQARITRDAASLEAVLVEAMEQKPQHAEEYALAIERIREAAEGAKTALDDLQDSQGGVNQAIGDYISNAMEYVTDTKARTTEMLSTVDSALANSIQGVLQGTMTIQEGFQSFFKSIGEAFLQMASKMIAKLIIIRMLKAALNLLPGTGGGGAAPAEGFNLIPEFPTFSEPTGFANGGIVKSPTHALIGEGGMNEAVVPLPNGKAIPVDMKGAAGGGNITSNVTVNINNEGNDSNSDPDGPAKLGRAIDTAVRKVIMDERRSGGLLYSGR